MANTIRLRRGSTTPSAGSFVEGEPAWDSTNSKLYIKNAAGAMVEIGVIADGSITSAKIADGTIVNADINASAAIADTKLATISTAGKVSNSATTATDANTVSTIVARNSSGNFSAGTITAALSGNASTATTLQTARTINGVSFNGSANITVTANTTNTLTRGTYLTGSNFNGSAATTWAVDATDANTASKVVARNASGNFSAGTITAALSGNASTATTLQTARTIWGQNFNGSANVTGALTGVTTIAASGDITMSGTGTIKVPVGTTAQRPTAVQGMIRYNTSRGCFEGYTGSVWVNMSPLTLDDVGAT